LSWATSAGKSCAGSLTAPGQASWNAWCASDLVALEDVDVRQVIHLAHGQNLTFYDASYLWLAEHHGAALVSLDNRLARVARSRGVPAPAPDTRDHTTPRSRN
jgi:hypothetical protein